MGSRIGGLSLIGKAVSKGKMCLAKPSLDMKNVFVVGVPYEECVLPHFSDGLLSV